MMNNTCLRNLLLTSLLVFSAASVGAAPDPPHNAIRNVGCLSCHHMTSTYPKLLPPLNHTPTAGDIDDTTSNGACWSCHNDTKALYVKTHSSLTNDNGYGDWTVECWVCHNEHSQEQDRYNASTYGKFIRRSINLANIKGGDGSSLGKTGIKSVKFLGQTGANSFADGEGTVDGICEVCHTMTYHWRNDGSLAGVGVHNGQKGRNCMACHPHSKGFHASSVCLDCHENAINNRAAVGQQFGGNSHHVQGTAVTSDKCFQCHWEADATGKLTSYHNATTGAAVDLVIYGAGARPGTYTLGSTAVAYTADASRDQILGINKHCLGCHSDQNNTTQPFGDGKTPKQYSWNGLSVDKRYSSTGTATWGKYLTEGAQKNQIKAYSAHGNAINNRGGGEAPTWVSTREGTVNVACFDCHNSHGSTASGITTSYASFTGQKNGGILKQTAAGTGGYSMSYAPQAGGSAMYNNQFNAGAALCFDCHLTKDSGSTPWGFNSSFGATKAILGADDSYYFAPVDGRITHAGGHFGTSSPLSTSPQHTIDGLCSVCHDPHGVDPANASRDYMLPLLKGTWLTSPYLTDLPPQYNGSSQTPGFNLAPAVINESASQFGGLCLGCHLQSEINPNGSTAWKSLDRIHNSVKGWGGTKHNYPCSKCHATHISARLPKLMKSNCMDYRHKGRVGYNTNPGISGSPGLPGSYDSCHGTNNVPSAYGVQEQYWNIVTPWEDRDDDDSIIYSKNSGNTRIIDCDDANPNIFRAGDGTCDGDGDGTLDSSAGGLDCDDGNELVGYIPAVCDKDNDNAIDWNYGGYDCNDSDPLVTAPLDGYCEPPNVIRRIMGVTGTSGGF